MKWTNYLILCLVLSAIIVASILFIPGLGGLLEAQLLSFLSANAS